MPSGRTRSQPERTPTVFFLDRGLGVHHVADAIRAAGHTPIPMSEVYPGGHDQQIGDNEWIAHASASGWIALTKDYAILRDHTAALVASTLRVFALSNANLTGPEMAQRYAANLNRILQRARQPGPYLYVVMRNSIELRWAP